MYLEAFREIYHRSDFLLSNNMAQMGRCDSRSEVSKKHKWNMKNNILAFISNDLFFYLSISLFHSLSFFIPFHYRSHFPVLVVVLSLLFSMHQPCQTKWQIYVINKLRHLNDTQLNEIPKRIKGSASEWNEAKCRCPYFTSSTTYYSLNFPPRNRLPCHQNHTKLT